LPIIKKPSRLTLKCQTYTRYLANALSNNNDKKGALEYFGQAIKQDPNNAELYLYDGIVRYNLDDREGAMTDFDKSIDLKPSAEAYQHRADMKLER
jgi:tetratricopeptide (TPR) repeat protein